MKRLTAVLLAVFCTLGFYSCGNKPKEEQLISNSLYSYEETELLEAPQYCPYEEDYLTELRETYQLDSLTAECKTDFDKVQAVAQWVTNLWAHSSSNVPPKGDPISILRDVTEDGAQYRCVEYGVVIAGCLNALGIPARSLGLAMADVETRSIGAGHVATEVYLKDESKWVFIDGQWGVIPMLGDVPLNAVELGAVIAQPENFKEELVFINLHNNGSTGYTDWILPYLYYFNVTCYPETGEPHGLMLTPVDAKDPHYFQGIPREMDEYTHSATRFYIPPKA